MARAGITYSEVAKAAARLAAEGKNPTVDTVREAIGGTGSKSTIAPMLKRWKSEHQEQVIAHDVDLPADLLQAVKGLYEHLQQEANQKVQAAQEALAAAQREFAEKLKAATEHAATLLKERDTLQSLLTQERARSDELTESNRAHQVARVKAETEAVSLVRRLEDRQNEVESLNRQLEQTRVQFEHYQQAVAAQRAEERREADQRCQRLEQELSDTRRALTGQQQTLIQYQVRAEQADRDIARLQNELSTEKQTLQKTTAEHRELEKQAHALSTISTELRTQLEQASNALTQARTELVLLQKEVPELKAQLASQEAESRRLLEEKSRLEGLIASIENGNSA